MEQILNTNARAVLEYLRGTYSHPTAMDVYEAVRQSKPRIGLATVYRILHSLAESGLIRELEGFEGVRYDANTNRHDHAICTACGALLDVPLDIALSEESLLEAARTTGLKLSSHEVRIYGRCASCQERDKS
ncbi:MAG TPA: transcriptional repressor [Ktedonobacteraceae bacterium]|jgi:Fe2+ or Zn2+ uptake regulation protein|nr:transcriptional repressor [Ktedonobacteraceae bacterium]